MYQRERCARGRGVLEGEVYQRERCTRGRGVLEGEVC